MSSLERFGEWIIPNFLELKVSEFFERRGVYKVPYQNITLFFIGALILSLITTSGIGFRFLQGTSVLTHIIVFIISIIIYSAFAIAAYIGYYEIKDFQRTQDIEKVLPDYLSLVVSNLRSGMTVDRSLWNAASPKFGVLTAEIRKAAKEVATGVDLSKSLNNFSKKYNSLVLNRAIDLIIEGLESGGELADVIEKVVDNIQQTVYLRKEMQAASLSYVIFITIIVIIISPFLFALSHNLLMIIVSIAQKISVPAGGGGFGALSVLASISNVSISPNDFKNFSYISIIIISMFSSMIISIINDKKIIGGLKYVPIFIVLSLLAFIVMSGALASLFSSLIG